MYNNFRYACPYLKICTFFQVRMMLASASNSDILFLLDWLKNTLLQNFFLFIYAFGGFI